MPLFEENPHSFIVSLVSGCYCSTWRKLTKGEEGRHEVGVALAVVEGVSAAVDRSVVGASFLKGS